MATRSARPSPPPRSLPKWIATRACANTTRSFQSTDLPGTRDTRHIVASIERHRGAPRKVLPSISWTVEPQGVLSPRDAYFAPHATVPAAEAVGRVSAELVAPYPPGIPVLAPGERITREAVEALQQALAEGTQVRYAADRTLRTFQIVADV